MKSLVRFTVRKLQRIMFFVVLNFSSCPGKKDAKSKTYRVQKIDLLVIMNEKRQSTLVSC